MRVLVDERDGVLDACIQEFSVVSIAQIVVHVALVVFISASKTLDIVVLYVVGTICGHHLHLAVADNLLHEGKVVAVATGDDLIPEFVDISCLGNRHFDFLKSFLDVESILLDLELFVAAVTAGYRDLRAQPVRLEERMSGSTVTSKTILRTLTDALSVLARRHTTDTYRITPEGAPAPAADLRLAA